MRSAGSKTGVSCVTLRPFQSECDAALSHHFGSEAKRAIISIPTGGGKTIVFSHFSHTRGYRTLVISHTDELVAQAADKFAFVSGEPDSVGIVKGKRWDNGKAFISSSIQTLSRNAREESGEWTGKSVDYLRANPVDLVVIDEAHHAAADTYQKVVRLILDLYPDVKLLGVTATPFRADEKDLKEGLFEEMVYAIGIKELVLLGYLVPIRARIFPVSVNLDAIKKVTNSDNEIDFHRGELSKALNRPEIIAEVVDKWEEHARERRTIFFASSIEHSMSLCDALRERGVSAAHIDGSMKLEARRELIAAFRNGEVQVLTNMNILIEGFDDPETDCIAMVRPTQSLGLYAQAIGRGLRPAFHVGKRECVVLDFSGESSERHTLANLYDLFGMDVDEQTKKNTRSFSIGSVQKEGGEERELKIVMGDERGDFDFFGSDSMEFITRVNNKTFAINGGKNGIVVVASKMQTGLWRVGVIEQQRGSVTVLEKSENLPEDYAIARAVEKWLEYRDDSVRHFIRNAKERPSEKQLALLRKIRDSRLLNFSYDPEKTRRFDAANIISLGFYMAQVKGVKLYTPAARIGDELASLGEIDLLSLGEQLRSREVHIENKTLYAFVRKCQDAVSHKGGVEVKRMEEYCEIEGFRLSLSDMETPFVSRMIRRYGKKERR